MGNVFTAEKCSETPQKLQVTKARVDFDVLSSICWSSRSISGFERGVGGKEVQEPHQTPLAHHFDQLELEQERGG